MFVASQYKKQKTKKTSNGSPEPTKVMTLLLNYKKKSP